MTTPEPLVLLVLCDWHEAVVQALETEPFVTQQVLADTAVSLARNCPDCQEPA